MSAVVILIVVAAAVVVGIVLFKSMWRVAEPNEALVITGWRHDAPDGVQETLGFKIVTGKGTLVIPGVQTVRRLSLDLRQAELAIDCVTHQGIPLGIKGVLIYKVGDDYASIANAARRFLDQQEQMDHRVHNVFAGHLRAIVGNMTVEEMIRDREKLTQLTRESSGVEMEKLGLIVDSLQIQEIDDPSGYISNLARPHAAAVQREARIAQAGADQEATQKEQDAEALKAEARRQSEVKRAGYQAEIDRAVAEQTQAGPLSEASARQQVVVQETKVAELEGQREEARLQATVRKPADAKAYEQVTLAKAQRDARIAAAEAKKQETELDAAAQAARVRLAAEAQAEQVRASAGAEADHVRLDAGARAEATRNVGQAEADATQAKGMAEAQAVKAKGLAEADAIKARAVALAENQDAVIGQQLAEQWPAIVEAAAKPFGAVDQMIVLNGAQGLSEVVAQALSQGVAGLQMARSVLSGGLGSNGGEHARHQEGRANGRPHDAAGDGAGGSPKAVTPAAGGPMAAPGGQPEPGPES
jgi:uncharacterized membrane protein YqiK